MYLSRRPFSHAMQKVRPIALAVGLLLLLIPLGSVQPASAAHPAVIVSVDYADYVDLDGDTYVDDIQIDVTLTADVQGTPPKKTELYLVLTLPSSTTYVAKVKIVGKFTTLHVTSLWFDTANEPGWYDVDAHVFVVGLSQNGYCHSAYRFDPPTGTGPGDPHVSITIW
ncbi:MAG: hypothetical protein ACTSYL_03035 [Candidatus Thorarchaeota archaeon]